MAIYQGADEDVRLSDVVKVFLHDILLRLVESLEILAVRKLVPVHPLGFVRPQANHLSGRVDRLLQISGLDLSFWIFLT